MAGALNSMELAERVAFELFAHAYPHEAAEINWDAFVEYTRIEVENPNLGEDVIREILKRTSGDAAQERR